MGAELSSSSPASSFCEKSVQADLCDGDDAMGDAGGKRVDAGPSDPFQSSRRVLLDSVANLRRERPELCDVDFVVGPGGARFSANSTVLALRSPYFAAMLFGPLRSDREKVTGD